jgi:hypothetical protein
MSINDYINTDGMGSRVSVPAFERMKQLYALGYTNAQIAETMHQEFQDIDYNPITTTMVKKLIAANGPAMDQARMELGEKCRDEIQRQTAALFRATEDVELTLVSVYVGQLKSVLEEMRELDLQEIDPETGNYKNTSRMFVLIEFVEKLQSKIAKIVGTDALREVEVFRQKAEAKRAAEERGTGLIPAHGRTLDETPTTNFI